jgi:DNA-binding transcriptional regulator YbjK
VPETPQLTAPALTPRRRELLDAALAVTAAHGLRGLTHRAVDRQAGLPEGSCSAYFRTRQALQHALARYLAQQLTDDVEQLSCSMQETPGDVSRAIELTTGLFLSWLSTPDVLRGLLELTLEATRDAELARTIGGWRTDLVGVVAASLARHGHDHAEERAEALVSASYGVLLAALLRPADDRRDELARHLSLVFTAVFAGG